MENTNQEINKNLNYPNQEFGEIDLRELWNGILRKKKWLFLSTGVVFLGSIIFTVHSRIFRPVFQGSFSLLIMDPMKSNNQNRNIYDSSSDLFQVLSNKSDDYEINTLISLLKSPLFIEPVANAIAGQSLNQMAMDRVGMQNTVASAGPTIVDNSTNTQNFNETNVRSPSANSPHVYGEFSDRVIRMSNVG